jgi:hypothetical protein
MVSVYRFVITLALTLALPHPPSCPSNARHSRSAV